MEGQGSLHRALPTAAGPCLTGQVASLPPTSVSSLMGQTGKTAGLRDVRHTLQLSEQSLSTRSSSLRMKHASGWGLREWGRRYISLSWLSGKGEEAGWQGL